MEEITQGPTNTVTIRIDVEGLSPESAHRIAQQFISWLDEQGEQDSWEAVATPGYNTIFDYNVEGDAYTRWIVIREYEPEYKDHNYYGDGLDPCIPNAEDN
jgi:hypothetical protein